ncbi:MAG: sugar phosphate isomerase/epimerase [Pirellulales bacterium]|nr:sugar phosphate isomerase/epimerase [Pirellulales bacterium]
MLALRIGLDLSTLAVPPKEALHVAARLGVDAVEIDARGALRVEEFSRTALRQLRKILNDLNLRVAALSYRSRRGLATPDELDRRVNGTKAAMQLAYGLGTNVIVGTLGPLPPPDSVAWQMLTSVLDDLGRHGQHVGATFVAETGTDSPATLSRLLGALPEGTLGIDLNPGSLVVAGYSPREAVQALGSWILHVHASDAIHGLAQGRGVRVPLGQGAVDLPAILGALEEFDYRGYFTIRPHEGSDAMHQASAAVQYLRRL